MNNSNLLRAFGISACLCLSLLGACSSTPSRIAATPATSTDDNHHAPDHTPETPVPESTNNGSDDVDETPGPSVSGKADEPPVEESSPQSLGEEAALRAIALVGKPYRYGGADLDGFDCSGLVFFIYHELGIEVPRSAAAQRRATLHVSRKDLLPGDLLFFRIHHRRVSHVGIYVGDNRFVHAPQSGKHIELRGLDEQFFASHWVGAGRVQ